MALGVLTTWHCDMERLAMRYGAMCCAMGVVLSILSGWGAEDAYLRYIRLAPEFKAVRQDPVLMTARWDTWIYMPWRYHWDVGTGDAGGRFCRDYGFNGGFTDHGDGPLEWLETWGLRFYNDHTAGKGDLYLYPKKAWSEDQRDPRTVRNGETGPRPLDAAALERLCAVVRERVTKLKTCPVRVAYALDDEVSWGSFVKPLPWRLHEDDQDYQAWLDRLYGGTGPRARYVTPEFTRKQLDRALKDIDLSAFLDRMSYNDSYWANVIGMLVEAANAVDPETPCGFVGGQSPNLFGGYDYAKLCRKVQFIEAYDIGSSQAIIRSFNPGNAMPQVTTHFHSDERGTANDIWQTWHYFAHGNRGMIGWVEGWFENGAPRPWLAEYRPTVIEVSQVQGPKLAGARWVHDGIAIYYSHPSIQVSWVLDAEAHGSTWVNRNGDHRLGTSHLTRQAWETMLTDSGLQYSFIPYDEVVTRGVPAEFKVVILPACYALSDIEALRFKQFCEAGGTLIADVGCGLFDQHGKGRSKGACDDLFGTRHDGTETAADIFAPTLWVETNQDEGFGYTRYRELFDTMPCVLVDGYALAERRLGQHTVRNVGKGRAIYVNLSPQRYLQYRQEGSADAACRNVFMQYVASAGIEPRMQVRGENGMRPAQCEVTTWQTAVRTYCFVVQNAAVSGSSTGGGGVEGLNQGKQRISVTLRRAVEACRDERAGRLLGSGQVFEFVYNPIEAVLFSFSSGAPDAGPNPHP